MGRPASCTCGECRACKHRAYMRAWYAKHPGYAAEQARKHRERAREYERARYAEDTTFRMKKRARNAVLGLIHRGQLERGPCEVCGEPDAQAHHDDYARPLEVRWLCDSHHRQHHGEPGKQAA